MSAAVGSYVLGNLFNQIVLPAIFGKPLQAVLEHRRPVLSMVDMLFLSFVLALLTMIVVVMIVRSCTRSRSRRNVRS